MAPALLRSRANARHVAEFLKAKPHFKVCLEPREIPDGWVAGVEDPAGNVIYVFDQTPGS